MKASIYTDYGDASRLSVQDVPRPVPGKDQLLIKVYTATANRSDAAMLTAKPFIMRLAGTGFFKPKKQTLGTDFAGVVEETGPGVTEFSKGDRVIGFDDGGILTHAEYTLLKKNKAIIKLPDDLDFETAVASIEGAHYAYNFLSKVDLKPGQKVMVNGATGAIGNAMMQQLKHFKAKVTVTCNTRNLEKITALGPDKIINYETEDFTQDNDQYDYVFDAVGKSTFGKCKRLLKPKGVYISSELGPNAQNLWYSLLGPLMPGRKVKFPLPLDIKRSLRFNIDLVQRGEFKPLIDRCYPLEQISEAFAYVLTGEKAGNVIININEAP